MQSNIEANRLMEGLLNGTLSSAEHARLDQLLRNDPQLRQQYLSLTELHLDLTHAVPPTPRTPLLSEHQATPSSGTAGGITLGRLDRGADGRRHHWRAGTWACAIAAASLMAAAVLWINWPLNPPVSTAGLPPSPSGQPSHTASDTQLPSIVEAAGVKIFSWGMAPAVGQSLPLGSEIVLTRGMLAIEFASGARAVLSAPSVFTPLAIDTLLVTSGQCSVHAPPGAEGFQVQTPSAKVVDLGTRFAVAVDAVGDTEVNVIDGAAALTSHAFQAAQPLMLRQGQTAAVDRGSRPATTIGDTTPVPYAASLPDRVVSYEASKDDAGLVDELISVSVQRGGKVTTYGREALTRGQLVGFASNPGIAVFCTRQGDAIPHGAERLELLTDWSLVTGIINPRSAATDQSSSTLGLEVQFTPPLVNGPGPDAVIFDLHLLVGAETGDTFNVSTDKSRADNRMIEIRQFDLDLTSPAALDLVPYQVGEVAAELNSLDDLIKVPVRARNPNFIRSKALATGIDLSELGYAAGESVSRLMIHDWAHDGQALDPVLIVGLP